MSIFLDLFSIINVGDKQLEYDYQLIIRFHIPTVFEKKCVRKKSDNLNEKVKKNQVSGAIPIDRARFSEQFGSRISFWDALSVDFEAVLVLSNIPTIFRKCSWNILIIFYKKH